MMKKVYKTNNITKIIKNEISEKVELKKEL